MGLSHSVVDKVESAPNVSTPPLSPHPQPAEDILKSWSGVPGVDPPRHGMLKPVRKWEKEIEPTSSRHAETARVMLRNVQLAS